MELLRASNWRGWTTSNTRGPEGRIRLGLVTECRERYRPMSDAALTIASEAVASEAADVMATAEAYADALRKPPTPALKPGPPIRDDDHEEPDTELRVPPAHVVTGTYPVPDDDVLHGDRWDGLA